MRVRRTNVMDKHAQMTEIVLLILVSILLAKHVEVLIILSFVMDMNAVEIQIV
jgi:hypothetical protein